VENSYSIGIVADVVSGCTVLNTGGTGIRATVVSDCYAHLSAGLAIAIQAGGPSVGGLVQNSYGRSEGANGIFATSVINSYGESVSGIGIGANTVLNCTARRVNGTAIQATVANGCYALSGTNNITYKFNMP
jgi:hypothetical protein